MKNINLDEIYSPEFYMEQKGKDLRIAIGRLNDVVQTVGDSSFSLIYSDEKEHSIDNSMERNIIRRFHLRHAVIDLNNCFDLLLQVIWFYQRIWDEYNTGGALERSRGNRYTDITRNTEGWVELANKTCDFAKVDKYLKNTGDPKLVDLSKELNSFKDTFVFNTSKDFTVRTLANMMKHKSAIRFEELNEPYNFTINTPQGVVDPRKLGLMIEMSTGFYDMDKEDGENNPDGKLCLKYTDDIYLDIEYNDGELFRAEDYLSKRSTYGLEEVRDECLSYHDAFIDLYEIVHKLLHDDISWSPLFKVPDEVKKSSTVNFDRYFKDTSQDPGADAE